MGHKRFFLYSKLTGFANLFLEGIKESIFCFPPALAWLVRQFYSIILEENKLESRQIAVICADLVFYFFICPAIVNPELFGIIEEGFYIGQIARFNLMQVSAPTICSGAREHLPIRFMFLLNKYEFIFPSAFIDRANRSSSGYGTIRTDRRTP